MSQYHATASPEVNPEIVSFFEAFYRTSDTPDAHELYADHLTSNAKLIMGSKTATGRPEILQMRLAMWDKVSSRSHKPTRVFPAGKDSEEVMLHGTVDYGFKDGKTLEGVEWAARAVFGEESGVRKMVFYQVYLDSAVMANAR
ncbi:hypothetical protein K431DRAFT_346493 [Polychaeton citri CBS 116435]|uniref:SnoaL-like domain-containing protein n=1 Tax=Polychaeton citri CBS 116435 TaxID=1314669 RepID=A0A9P4Q8J1_9PEZI|nr:hypothetical protein K431DRAFT_346493 [Polychaeton citri CBS 116435]